MTTQGITVTLFGRTDVGKGRKNDEDAFVVSNLTDPSSSIHVMTSPVSFQVAERGILMAVSDGMGGAQAGEVASSLVLSAVRRCLCTVLATDADAALRVSVEVANQHVFSTAQATGRGGMGATLTAVVFHGIYAYIAEIGDSRAYLLRANRLVQLTHDQSYVQQLIDSGATQEQSEASEYKNVILQAMGIKPTIAVVTNNISVRRNDRFLLCSDGLSGKLKDQEILNVILASATLESACAKLVETAVEHGSEDDITVILGEVTGDGAPAMTDAERLSIETSKVFSPT